MLHSAVNRGNETYYCSFFSVLLVCSALLLSFPHRDVLEGKFKINSGFKKTLSHKNAAKDHINTTSKVTPIIAKFKKLFV